METDSCMEDMSDVLCSLQWKTWVSLCCSEKALQMYETFGAAYPLESVYSMNNMSHSLGVIPELESSSLL